MNIINSIDNTIIKNLKKLTQKKYRDINNKFIVEGFHLVEEAYISDVLEEIFAIEGYNINLDVKKTYISDKVMKYISNLESHREVIGIVRKKTNSIINGNILYLDNIQDPGNLGTIIRSSYAFNLDTLILSNDTVDLYNDKVIRASQGMLFKQNIIIGNINTLKDLKNKGYKIYGTDVNNGIDVKTIERNEKNVIIFGNEGQGIKEEVRNLCDNHIYININKDCESLNVSVAASIILYELKD